MLEIKRIRTEQGVSLSELARRTGTFRSHLQRIEEGGVNPQARTLDRIADALGVETGDLFARTRELATTA